MEDSARSFEGRRKLGTVYYKERQTSGVLSLSGDHTVEKWIVYHVNTPTVAYENHDLVEFVLSEDFVVITRSITANTMERPFAGWVLHTEEDHILVDLHRDEEPLRVPKPDDVEELYKGDIVTFAFTPADNLASKLVLVEKTPIGRPVVGECPVCFEEEISLFTVCNCKHVMCSECTKEWLLTVYKDLSMYPLTCSMAECQNFLNFADAAKVLNSEQFSEMEKFYCFAAIPPQNRSKCPRCDYLLFYGNRNPVGKCTNCDLRYCGRCSVTFEEHKGRTCEELSDQLDLEALARESGWQKCPQCSTTIEKSSGCNHMTHVNCPHPYSRQETHFCYCCGTLLGDARHTPDGQVHFPQGMFKKCINRQ